MNIRCFLKCDDVEKFVLLGNVIKISVLTVLKL